MSIEKSQSRIFKKYEEELARKIVLKKKDEKLKKILATQQLNLKERYDNPFNEKAKERREKALEDKKKRKALELINTKKLTAKLAEDAARREEMLR